jgi:hypothetical protein
MGEACLGGVEACLGGVEACLGGVEACLGGVEAAVFLVAGACLGDATLLIEAAVFLTPRALDEGDATACTATAVVGGGLVRAAACRVFAGFAGTTGISFLAVGFVGFTSFAGGADFVVF